MGSRIHKMDSAQGFAAQGAGAAVILASTHGGFPLSTTHTISGAVIGSGAAKRLSAVRWGVAGNIVAAWIVTLPVGGVIGAARLRRHAPVRDRRGRAAGRVGGDRRRVGAALLEARAAGPAGRAGGGLMFATIDWDALLTVIWSSAAGRDRRDGGLRPGDPGRHPGGRPRPRAAALGEAAVYGLIGAIGVATVVAAIVFGIVVLSSK